jgi:glycosyltransferase involved in cell wall biosynthesis
VKILLANKFYYPRGGDCIYTIGLESLLLEAGHEVAVFAMEHPETIPGPWNRFFPSEVSFSPKKPIRFLKALSRPLHSREVVSRFTALLDEFRPDVLHLNNIHTQLSPVIAELAHARGVRVVWTLHDYKLLCPRYDCLRDGKPCELCFGDDKSGVLKHSCMKGSRIASSIAWLEARKWNRARLEACTDAFICPSRFMKSKMEQGGFAPEKLHVLHNFFDESKVAPPLPPKGSHYCYVGRLTEEKGIRTLLEVASELPHDLKVLGTGPLDSELRERFASFPQIEFLGHQAWPAIREILASAKCMVLPSEWYENCPLSVLESLALGTPVVGADIGGIPELLVGNDQHLFESGNRTQLRARLVALLEADPVPVQPSPAPRRAAYVAELLKIIQCSRS